MMLDQGHDLDYATRTHQSAVSDEAAVPFKSTGGPLMDVMSQYGEQRMWEKHNKAQERLIRDFGEGATTLSQSLIKQNLEILVQAYAERLEEKLDDRHGARHLLRVLKELSPEVIALSVLQNALHTVATESTYRSSCELVGRGIANELFAAGLTRANKKLAQRIEHAVGRRHGRLKDRLQAARSIAKRAGFEQHRWTKEQKIQAGNWLLDVLQTALPTVFVAGEEKGVQFLTVTPEAQAFALEAVAYAVENGAPYLPSMVPPTPWTDFNVGGNPDPREDGTPLIRTHHKETAAACRAAIKSGQMQPALDAVNALQAVPWSINTRILDVLKACQAQGIAVKGLPQGAMGDPAKPRPWDEMTEAEQRLWKYRKSQVMKANRKASCDRVLWEEDLRTAELVAGHGRFWTPFNMDWRGRVYPTCHFNFQRDDRIRAMFLFAEGEPIGTDGLWWLKVHLANCGDFEKISKRPFEERVAWVDQNAAVIAAIAENPLADEQLAVWSKADKPFLFLAACVELTGALASGPTFVTRLPVSWDGSCSGLQHLCAMTRASEGALVNLVSSPEPQDVYQTVADRVMPRIAQDVVDGEPVAKLWQDFLLSLSPSARRKVFKRNVMTFAYSSKKFGMAKQHDEDTLDELEFDVLSGKYEEHPFEAYAGHGPDTPSAAARYIAAHTYREIEAVVPNPAGAMVFLQSCARALAHEGKPMTWVTPTGLPWVNRYHKPVVRRIRLWCHDRGATLKIADGYQKEIDKEKAASGVAPNLVHACDAAHLQLTVNAAVREGITAIATVHDSFGCLASRARRFNEIIREQFVAMYEQHDVLTQVRDQAFCDLTSHNQHRLPDVPHRGPLDLKEVLNAPYAFA
jgi:DNA-directed RNA polymerase